MTQAISESSKRVDTRNRHHHDSNRELFDEESKVVNSVRNRRARNRGSGHNNMDAIKMQIPSFKRRVDIEAHLEWEKKAELIFACHNYSEEKKVRLVAMEFSDYVLIWWDELVKSRRKSC